MVLSRSEYQLRGDTYGLETSLKTCEPMRFPRTMVNGTVLVNTSAAVFPCGLAAWSYFNDTYAFATAVTNASQGCVCARPLPCSELLTLTRVPSPASC